jgi:DNA polymerase
LTRISVTSSEPSLSAAAAARALLWLAEAGADENILDAGQNRFEVAAEAAKPTPPAAKAAAVSFPASGTLAERASALARGCATLAELQDALRGFAELGLSKSASNLCFCAGAMRPRVLVLGAQPGRDEDLAGLPFADKRALLLERMLAAIGLSAAETGDALLANVVPFRPPGDRKPSDIEISLCLPFVTRLIALTQPRFILSLGALPARHLAAGDEAVTRQRGRWLALQPEGAPPIRVMTTFAPDYLLRQPQHKRLAWADLLALREAIDGD